MRLIPSLLAESPGPNPAMLSLLAELAVPADDADTIRAQRIIPPPGPDGWLNTRDGRRLRVRDMHALLAAIRGQDVEPRVDWDHASEPTSPTYRGSTEAAGWVRNLAVAGDGGLVGDLVLQSWAAQRVRDRSYRYLSPAVLHDDAGDVGGLSSVAGVNNPNLFGMDLAVHARRETVENETQDAAALDRRSADLDRREADLDRLALQAAEQDLDAAIEAGHVLPAHREHHLDTVRAHRDGVYAGAAALRRHIAALAQAPSAADLDGLTRRAAPTGDPRPAAAGARFVMPAEGAVLPPRSEALTTHAAIARFARERGISFQAAAVEAAQQGLV